MTLHSARTATTLSAATAALYPSCVFQRAVGDSIHCAVASATVETAKTIQEAAQMLKREVWNNVFTPPWRGLRLLLFALAIILIASSIGELKKTQGQSSSTCNLSYRETTFWPTGFQGEITIRNSGP